MPSTAARVRRGLIGAALFALSTYLASACTSSSPQGPTALDASTDVQPEAGAASPCAQPRFFCDDFDKGAVGATWDGKDLSGGPLATDETTYRSAPRAFRAQSAASPTPRSVVLYKQLPDPPGKRRCSFDVLVRQRAGAGYADLFEIRLNTGDAGGYYYAYLQVTETGTFVGQEVALPSGKDAKLNPVANLPTGAWRHVEFETDFASFTFRYEGEPAHTETLRVTDGTKPQLALGLVYTEGGGPFDFLFDNVACD